MVWTGSMNNWWNEESCCVVLLVDSITTFGGELMMSSPSYGVRFTGVCDSSSVRSASYPSLESFANLWLVNMSSKVGDSSVSTNMTPPGA